jgi:hypothetical protein
MNATNDEELLHSLGTVLAPTAVEPGPEELAGLHRALAARLGEAASVSAHRRAIRQGWGWVEAVWMATAFRFRHSVAALVAGVVLVTGGVAAAGVASNTLPGPTRAVAFRLGLPVSSPNLVAAQSEVAALQAALDSRDVSAARSAAAALRQTMATMSASDLDQIEPEASALLAEADTLVIPGPTRADGDSRHSGPVGTDGDRAGTDDAVPGRSGDGGGTGHSPGGPSGSSGPGNVETGGDGSSSSPNSGSGSGNQSGSGSSGGDSGSGGSGSSGSGSTPGGSGSSGSGSTPGGSGSSGGSSGGSSPGGSGDARNPSPPTTVPAQSGGSEGSEGSSGGSSHGSTVTSGTTASNDSATGRGPSDSGSSGGDDGR